MSSVDDPPQIPKIEPFEEEDFSESTPEPDESNTQEIAQVQKRKGGRKPIYATSEERKQRNRQAQAAFRERRTEYIKQLETTIKHHEDTLQSLQQSHRSAADECLMLRYKNSLLERILLEKGIDVQAELRSKTEGSHALSHTPSSATIQPSPVQRAVMNRHHQPRRSTSGSVTKALRPQHTGPSQPPRLQPTPPLNTMSPAIKSPHGSGKGMMMPPSSDPSAQRLQQQSLQPRINQSQPPSRHNIPANGPNLQSMPPGSAERSNMNDLGVAAGAQASYNPSLFQAHNKQLEQEFDAHADLLDDENPSDSSTGPGPYPRTYHHQSLSQHQQNQMGVPGHPPIQHMQAMQPMQSMGPPSTTQSIDPNGQTYGAVNPGLDPYDPGLDADPFGLTASMHFPTQFTFQESSLRR